MIQKTLKCDICGKVTGENGQLKDKDFIKDSAMKLKTVDYKGEPIIISLNMNINKQDAKKNSDNILKDAMDEYTPFNYLIDEDDFDQNIMSYHNFMEQQQNVNKVIMQRLQNSTNKSHICKTCCKGLMKLVAKFAETNKTITF
jgi:hypothetical protein